jgi:hypothetical protein
MSEVEYYKVGPTITNNSLKDIIDCLNLGDVVVLTIGLCIKRIHHKCNDKEMDNDKIMEYLSKRRVIFIDLQKMPGLADDGEWNYYFEIQKDVKSCTCKLSNFLIKI